MKPSEKKDTMANIEIFAKDIIKRPQTYKSVFSYIKTYWCFFVPSVFLIIAIIYDFLPIAPHNTPSGDSLMPPSFQHWLGTDDLGMDVLSQLLYGTRLSMFLGIASASLSVGFGTFIGVFSAYVGGKLDSICLIVMDTLIALPELPLMIVLSAYLGPNIVNIIIAISIISWVMPAKLIRSKTLQITSRAYVSLSNAYGARFAHVFKRHIFADIFPIMAVSSIKILNRAILAEAGLAFLGLSDPISKSWGMVMNRALSFSNIFLTDYWKWWLTSPTLFLIIFALSMSALGRKLEFKLSKMTRGNENVRNRK